MRQTLACLPIFAVLMMLSMNLLVNANAQDIQPCEAISTRSSATNSAFPTNATFETKAEVFGNALISAVGGSHSDYYAQSFKALSDYLINGGLWLQGTNEAASPNLRLMLCATDAFGQPDVAEPVAISQVISNATIMEKPGRFYLNLTTPIRVQQNQIYWLVIDGCYDRTSPGSAHSQRRVDNPYLDGAFAFSNDSGTTWTGRPTDDLDFVAYFSNRPNKIEVFDTNEFNYVGGLIGADYFAQSFKALDSYVVDAGVWIQKSVEPTPSFRGQIWGSNATGYPDKSNIIASSKVIKGKEINSTDGQRFFIHPPLSIPVNVGEIYWLIIDGHFDGNATGSAMSRCGEYDPYKDGFFVYSNDAGSTWNSDYSSYDLNFVAAFASRPSAIQVEGDRAWGSIGGTSYWSYAGQSFKALNRYILDAGIWLQNNTRNCPDTRILLCKPTAEGHPNVTHPIASSIPILGIDVNATNPHRYFLRPPKPVEVIPSQTYYLMIDGQYDRMTVGSARTYERYDDPYPDGWDCGSHDGGVSWIYWNSYDLDVDIRFSDVPAKVQCDGNMVLYSIGGESTTYFAQSFVTAGDYIADAGIRLGPCTSPTPSFRILLCRNNATGYDHPELKGAVAVSAVIEGVGLSLGPSLHCIGPTVPIPVNKDQIYWIVVDGSMDSGTTGNVEIHAVDYDAYPDGEFLYADADIGQGWHNATYLHAYDLEFSVSFTHINQMPTEPNVRISPQRPHDSDSLDMDFVPSLDLEQEPIIYYVEWCMDNVLQPETIGSLRIHRNVTSPGERWKAKVTPNDGHINGTAGTCTVLIEADTQTIDHVLVAFGQSFHVLTTANVTISNFCFNEDSGKIVFTAAGPTGFCGFCNITIPKTLMRQPWLVKVNDTEVEPTLTENLTHTLISLNFSTSSIQIEIQGQMVIPEFTPTTMLIAATLAVSTMAVKRKITSQKKRLQTVSLTVSMRRSCPSEIPLLQK